MDIKEIAKRLVHGYWKRDQWNIEYFDSVGFAEALISAYKAELLKEVQGGQPDLGEPVAWIRPKDIGSEAAVVRDVKPFADWKSLFTSDQLAASQLHAEQLREKIEALWDIIDDIDSYGDMAKADDKLFRSLVEKRQKDRWETGITTDGYVLNMPIPRDTSALDAYVAEKVKEHDSRHVPEAMK